MTPTSPAADPTPSARKPRLRRPNIHFAWIVIGTVIVIAISLIVIASFSLQSRSSDLWMEIAKSSLQIMVLSVSGGVVGAVLRDRDAARDARERRRQRLLAHLEKVDASYGHIKAGRRLLRTLGFDVPSDRPLTPEQVAGFRTQMALLNEAQLSFEADARRVPLLAADLGPTQDELKRLLDDIAAYLRRVLFEFEADPTVFVAGGDSMTLARWPHYLQFVQYDDASTAVFTAQVIDRMSRVEAIVLEAVRPSSGGRP
ncbi:MAG: hypothetical protein U0869_08900 [Chloroflexota bacterium]